MTKYFQKEKCKKRILVGDLNIAPGEYDVWSHKQLLNVVSYTSIEREKLKDFLHKWGWFDIVRLKNSPDKKLFSWWSYRSKDWKDSNRGRRLDHIFSSSDITKKVKKVEICKELRNIDKPSDHVPIIVDIKI